MLRAELPNRVFETSPRWLSAKLLRARGHSLAIYHQGEWKNDQPKLTTANGDTYVGRVKDGKPHGEGTTISSDGAKYVGEHKDGTLHGKGTYTFANGDKYDGQHKDGKKHGKGTYTYADGRKYVGEYKDDAPRGVGTLFSADGTIEYQGKFENYHADRT